MKALNYNYKNIGYTLRILLMFSLFLGSLSSTAEQIKYDHSKASNQLILSYTESNRLLEGVDVSILLKVYGDGTVRVHYPPVMKKAGDYYMRLNQVELDNLLQSLVKDKILEFKPDEVLSEKKDEVIQSSLNAESTLFAVSDVSTFSIELNLEKSEYSALSNSNTAENLQTKTDINKKISWSGIRADSKQFPNIVAIQNLAKARKIILDLKESSRLVRSK